jgi:Tfp pilus assembly protein PilF
VSYRRLIILMLMSITLYSQSDWSDLLKEKKAEAYAAAKNSQGYDKAFKMLKLGYMADFAKAMEEEALSPAERLILEARLQMQRHRFEDAESLLNKVKKWQRGDKWFAAWYDILEYSENDAELEKLSRAKMRKRNAPAIHQLAYSRWLITQLRFDEAEKNLQSLILPQSGEKQELLRLKMMLEMQRYHYDAAWNFADSLIKEAFLDAPLLSSAGQILIRLNRVNDAISAFEMALECHQLNETAHYMLGNGYTRSNYSQLEEKYPDRFVLAGALKDSFLVIQDFIARRDFNLAREALLKWTEPNMHFAEPYVWLGALDWEQGNFNGAIEYYQRALALVPNYGRAHAGIAKSLEGLHMQASVYRTADDRAFLRTEKPTVPNIEKYILNWHELSPRHQKRVALSVAPLQQYIPVLLASGSHHYIKPLYMKLSDVPGLATLKDQRISYDSRLWDDVRGCGGYTTVTGIEDVERMIYHRYNTIIHEMTHQVHGLLTLDEKEAIENLYLKAKEAEAKGEKRFISRYQKASVWEYLAEGVNAAVSPKRNKYDSREITLERLQKMDPQLLDYVKKFFSPPNIEPYFAVGLSNALYDRMESADTLAMLQIIAEAKEKGYQSYEMEMASAFALLLLEGPDSVEKQITGLLEKYPLHQQAYQTAFITLTMKQSSPLPLLDTLEKRIGAMTLRQEIESRLLLAQKRLEETNDSLAVEEAKKALKLDETVEAAHWILGNGYSALGDSNAAIYHFEKAISYQNGVIELRADYLEHLIKFSMLKKATQQLEELYSLNRSHYRTQRSEALLNLALGDTAKACIALNHALEDNPYDLRSRLLLAACEKSADRSMPQSLHQLMSRAPWFYYDAKWMQYKLANVWTPALIAYAAQLFPEDAELKKLTELKNGIRNAPEKTINFEN